jgi:hypothetical protein
MSVTPGFERKNRAASFVPAVDRSFKPPARLGRTEPSGCSGVTVSQERSVPVGKLFLAIMFVGFAVLIGAAAYIITL